MLFLVGFPFAKTALVDMKTDPEMYNLVDSNHDGIYEREPPSFFARGFLEVLFAIIPPILMMIVGPIAWFAVPNLTNKATNFLFK